MNHGAQVEAWGGFGEGKNYLFTNPVLADVGETAQVLLRWLIQRNIVTIPKSVRGKRMEQNLDVFDFGLSDDDMARTATLKHRHDAVLRSARPGHGERAGRPQRTSDSTARVPRPEQPGRGAPGSANHEQPLHVTPTSRVTEDRDASRERHARRSRPVASTASAVSRARPVRQWVGLTERR